MLLLQRGGCHKPTPRSRLRPLDHRSLAATCYIRTFLSLLISTFTLVAGLALTLALTATGCALKAQDVELLAFTLVFITGLLIFYICSYGMSKLNALESTNRTNLIASVYFTNSHNPHLLRLLPWNKYRYRRGHGLRTRMDRIIKARARGICTIMLETSDQYMLPIRWLNCLTPCTPC